MPWVDGVAQPGEGQIAFISFCRFIDRIGVAQVDTGGELEADVLLQLGDQVV